MPNRWHRISGYLRPTGFLVLRNLIGSTQNVDKLTGQIEADLGDACSGDKRAPGAEGKTIIMAMAQRGGEIRTVTVLDVKKAT
ncbi:hypothetical protein [Devosia sp.]|uniref:hypothetical protein n=1 Tax=Devosia sp. TaxID=1871048 RepID=UPI003266CE68